MWHCAELGSGTKVVHERAQLHLRDKGQRTSPDREPPRRNHPRPASPRRPTLPSTPELRRGETGRRARVRVGGIQHQRKRHVQHPERPHLHSRRPAGRHYRRFLRAIQLQGSEPEAKHELRVVLPGF